MREIDPMKGLYGAAADSAPRRIDPSPAIAQLQGPLGPLVGKIAAEFTPQEQIEIDSGIFNSIGTSYSHLQRFAVEGALSREEYDSMLQMMREYADIKTARTSQFTEAQETRLRDLKKQIKTLIDKLLDA